MNVEPILIMASAVLVFTVVALGIGTVLGMVLGQARVILRNRKAAPAA